MLNLPVIKKLTKEIYILFKDGNSGHDFSHLKRVMQNAIYIQKREGGDLYIIAISALVHDIHRLVSNQKGYFVRAEDCLDVVEKILKDCGIEEDKIKEILYIVENHERKREKIFNLETYIVQDADILDALGKIGLKRCLKYCKTHKIPVSNTKYPLNSPEFIPDINPISSCHYIYNTIIPNADFLYTETAKKMAKGKVKMLENFVKHNYK